MPIDLNTIIVALFSLVGTLVGVYVANSKTTALISYRLEQLEEKVQKHNNIVERMYHLEERASIIEEKIKELEDNS